MSARGDALTVTLEDTERAKNILLGRRRISARDALHTAVMERLEITRIMSFDRDFDALPRLTRLHD